MAGAGRASKSGVSSRGSGGVGGSGGEDGLARGTPHGFDGVWWAQHPQQTGNLGQSGGHPMPLHVEDLTSGGFGGLHLAFLERSREAGGSARRQEYQLRHPHPQAGRGT